MPSDGRRIIVDSDSTELRRRLGATAWVVFEELLLASTDDGGSCTATTSVRALAVRTGFVKDTVARALLRLGRAGLISAQQSRSAGAFAAGSYRLLLPCGVTVEQHLVNTIEAVQPVVAQPSGSVRLPRVDLVQLAFEIEG